MVLTCNRVDNLIRLTERSVCYLIHREVIMFESVDEKRGGMPWGMIAGLLAFAGLLVAGYFVVS
jgi:hypothetical protein